VITRTLIGREAIAIYFQGQATRGKQPLGFNTGEQTRIKRLFPKGGGVIFFNCSIKPGFRRGHKIDPANGPECGEDDLWDREKRGINSGL
jgi:hypothetical protein